MLIRLRELREENNLTQEKIADILNVSRTAYANWEIGRSEPSVDMLINIANFYNVSIDYLCELTSIRDAIYKDPQLCNYLNKCINIYDEFFNK